MPQGRIHCPKAEQEKTRMQTKKTYSIFHIPDIRNYDKYSKFSSL
ncbi:hypothetical protein BACUNI_03343 [Bacteroides uniformis ATCC 8492]|uniref:Uncharacterized protein n=1 Tax=Bacteroides uniformis (strain ATCC 8492 / DSM 6597 / CCUG 4942 / CIP 103695 / JCM 5828 / KCTC 5204 / NCTC 13054 / VPI 0061) TaxID=411479 RepID=A0ABC9N957_BACUC|nr:hypothetical protein BACUNI_03343 [Bacteroides uniformis ATCC 8492]